MNLGDTTEQSLQQLVELQRTQVSQNEQLMNLQQMNGQQQKASGVNYMPPMVSFAPQTQMQQQQFVGYAQQASSSPNRYGFFDTMYVNNSRVSNQSRQLMAADYGARLSNATIAGAGALGSTLTDLGISTMIPGFLGSMIGGTIAGAAVGGAVDIGLDQAKQSQAYNKYLLKNSYMMVNPLNSTNERDIAGFNQSQRHEASTFLRHENTDFYMKDEETMQLLQKFTEGGMLKDTKDLNDFKTKMKSLTQTVKEGALILNETYGTIADMMSEMRKSGIADKNFDPLMSKSKVVGSMLGISASSALTSAINGASGLTQGTEISNDTMTSRMQNSMLYTDKRYSELKEKKQAGTLTQNELREYNAITDAGGAEQMSKSLIGFQNQLLGVNNGMMAKDAIAFFDYDSKSNDFSFNRDKFNNFLNGNTSLDDISKQATTVLNSMSKTGQEKWMQKGQTYMLNNMDYGQMNNFDSRFLDSMRKLNPTYASMSDEQLMGQLGVNDSPERTAFAGSLNTYKKDNGQLLRQMDAASMRETVLSQINSKNPGFMGQITNQWEKFKDVIGDPFQAVSDKITDWTQGFQDFMYGKKYTSADYGDIANHDYSTKGLNKQISDTNYSIASTQNTLADLKKQGVFVDGSLVDSLKNIQSFNNGNQDWKNTYIKENRQTFNSSQGLEDIKIGDSNLGNQKEYKLLKDQSDKNNLSETIVAALMKFGQQNGNKSIMDMSSSMLDEASKSLGKKVYGTGDQGLADGAAYLGKLNGLYGGNQNLALSAFFSSQGSIDQALRAQGIDINALRNGGDINSLQGLDWTKIVTDKNVQNSVNGVNGTEKVWTGSNHDGAHYDVKGFDVTGGPIYQDSYDYQRGGKKSVADTNNGVDIYDTIHYYAKQNGVSPNALASMVGIESGGNVNAKSPVGAQGLMQMMPGTFEQYIGKEMTLPDGSKKTISAGDINDPYANAFAGSDYYSKQLKTFYNNPYLAYAAYNAGPGVGSQISNYLKQDLGIDDKGLSGVTAQQVIDAIQKHWAYGGDHGINGETDKAVGMFSGIYNQGLIMPTSTTVTHKATASSATRYFNEADGKALSTEEISKLISDATGQKSYEYDPTALSNLHKSVNKTPSNKSIHGIALGGNPNNLNYGDALDYYNRQIGNVQTDINHYQNNVEYDAKNGLIGDIAGLFDRSNVKQSQSQLDKLNSSRDKLRLDFDTNIARSLGIDKLNGENDNAFMGRVDAVFADETQKNLKMLNSADWNKKDTNQKSQIMDFLQTAIKSGKAEQLGVNIDDATKKLILGGDTFFNDNDKKVFKAETGKANANYQDYIDAAQRSSWFTDVKSNSGTNIFVGKGAKTDDILKAIEKQKTDVTRTQLDAQDKMIAEYQKNIQGTASHFAPQDQEKINGLIQNPGKASLEELNTMISQYQSNYQSGHDPNVAKQIEAMQNLAKTMEDNFGKNTDALIAASKQFQDIKDTAKGFSEITKLMSETISQIPEQSQAIKDFVSVLDRDSTKLQDSVGQGPEEQTAALKKAQTDITNSISALITDDQKSNKQDLKLVVDQMGKTKGLTDDQMAALENLAQEAEGKSKNADGSYGANAITPENIERQKKAQKDLFDELTGMIVDQSKATSEAADGNKDAATKLGTAGDQFATAADNLVKGVTTAIATLKTGVDQAKTAAGVAEVQSEYKIGGADGFTLFTKYGPAQPKK